MRRQATGDKNKLKLSRHAVQNWSLLRFVSLLIGDKIFDTDDEVRKQNHFGRNS